ncbi:hypothetical protein [Nocardia canadensis]|uniref:hypothetical protein n=1 Tax=Nocardia canadensis TaxID=3065238 RepID=UPI00292E388B|nr:hypothetical protein [Nocardia canadensis]
MSTLWFVVVLVAGILAVLAIVSIPIIVWLRRRGARVTEALTRDLRHDVLVRGPEQALYRGASAPGFPAAKGNGVVALTATELHFRPYLGSSFAVPVAEIVSAREAKVFRGAVTGGRTHLVVDTRAGEVGFFVADNAAWLHAIEQVTGR